MTAGGLGDPERRPRGGGTHRCLLLLLLTFFSSVSATEITDDEFVVVSDAEAVAGGAARLPCDLSAEKGDVVRLVIWYREGNAQPVYTYDARAVGTKGSPGRHWSEATISPRVGFVATDSPAVLVLRPVTAADQGGYRCRVDFKRSPTRNARVNLTVIVPPSRIEVRDSQGRILDNQIGPVGVDSYVEMTCLVFGGRPTPRVTWWRDGALLDDVMEAEGATVPVDKTPSAMAMGNIDEAPSASNVLRFGPTTRMHQGTALTCQASNSAATSPLSARIEIDLLLEPLSVVIESRNAPLPAGASLSAHHPALLSCRVLGSRPAAYITWWKGGVQMQGARSWTTQGGNWAMSELSLTPTLDDAGKTLVCRAETPGLVGSTKEASWRIAVSHPPVLTAELSTPEVEEGKDVSFHCKVRSNPWPRSVYWTFNDKPLGRDPTAMANNQSLVLLSVGRERAGNYSCIAENSEGSGRSVPVRLSIKFVPTCGTRPSAILAPRGGKLAIKCPVVASEDDKVFVRWTLPNGTRVAGMSLDSPVLLKLSRPNDFGDAVCWPEGRLGKPEKPCRLGVVQREPSDCAVRWIQDNSAVLKCSSPGAEADYAVVASEKRSGKVLGNGSLGQNLRLTRSTEDVVAFELRSGEVTLLRIETSAPGMPSTTAAPRTTSSPPLGGPTAVMGAGSAAAAAAAAAVVSLRPLLCWLAGGLAVLIGFTTITIAVLRARGRCSDDSDEKRCGRHGAPVVDPSRAELLESRPTTATVCRGVSRF